MMGSIRLPSVLFSRFLSSQSSKGRIEISILKKLEEHFKDSPFKEVKNTSWKHSVPKNSETHFEVLLVSDKFENKSILERNRFMNELLNDEIKQIHSISYRLLTSTKWKETGKPTRIINPPCASKSK